VRTSGTGEIQIGIRRKIRGTAGGGGIMTGAQGACMREGPRAAIGDAMGLTAPPPLPHLPLTGVGPAARLPGAWVGRVAILGASNTAAGSNTAEWQFLGPATRQLAAEMRGVKTMEDAGCRI